MFLWYNYIQVYNMAQYDTTGEKNKKGREGGGAGGGGGLP
jgi:hypothetical protein